MTVESQFLHDNIGCLEGEVEQPLMILMENGHMLRIDRAVVKFKKTIIDQLSNGDRFEVKFCVSDDNEIPGTSRVEQYQLVYFPMYRKHDEIAHAAIDSDSIVNGNIVIENGKVASVSSNYHDYEYAKEQSAIVEFATEHFRGILDNC